MPLLSGPVAPRTGGRAESSCRKCNRDFNFILNRGRRCNHCGAWSIVLLTRVILMTDMYMYIIHTVIKVIHIATHVRISRPSCLAPEQNRVMTPFMCVHSVCNTCLVRYSMPRGLEINIEHLTSYCRWKGIPAFSELS